MAQRRTTLPAAALPIAVFALIGVGCTASPSARQAELSPQAPVGEQPLLEQSPSVSSSHTRQANQTFTGDRFTAFAELFAASPGTIAAEQHVRLIDTGSAVYLTQNGTALMMRIDTLHPAEGTSLANTGNATTASNEADVAYPPTKSGSEDVFFAVGDLYSIGF